jgi:SAM-dependent methyltransferase
MQKASRKTEFVREYYGKILQDAHDLKTGACCCSDALVSPFIRDIEGQINSEILTRFYGCGSPIPPAIEGCIVLDLGCGTGRDVFIASRLVGAEGFVIGIDMTDEQLEIARRHLNSQMKKFGYKKPNVEFKKGYIENLKEIGIKNNSIDVVMSNCVINLSMDKRAVFSEIFRVLKPGGELYFSDIFTGRRIPHHLADDPVLYSECLGGAMYIEDFRRLLMELGCLDYRIVKKQKVVINNPAIETKIGTIDFYSMTVRVFKLSNLEDICEDYGQIAVYRGTIPGYPHAFELDDHHRFITDKPMLVCGNTAMMLEETRLARHFKVMGDRSVHYGPFNCAPAYVKLEEGKVGGACC